MRITVSGMPGAGKTGAAKYLSKKLHLRCYSTTAFMKMLAERNNMHLRHLSKLSEGVTFDRRIDHLHNNLQKEDDFVVDSRLGVYFFPDAINIYLAVKPEIAIKRLVKRELLVEREMETIKRAVREIVKREDEAREAFKKDYGIDIYDKKNYEIYLDTSDMTRARANKVILKRVLALRKAF